MHTYITPYITLGMFWESGHSARPVSECMFMCVCVCVCVRVHVCVCVCVYLSENVGSVPEMSPRKQPATLAVFLSFPFRLLMSNV